MTRFFLQPACYLIFSLLALHCSASPVTLHEISIREPHPFLEKRCLPPTELQAAERAYNDADADFKTAGPKALESHQLFILTKWKKMLGFVRGEPPASSLRAAWFKEYQRMSNSEIFTDPDLANTRINNANLGVNAIIKDTTLDISKLTGKMADYMSNGPFRKNPWDPPKAFDDIVEDTASRNQLQDDMNSLRDVAVQRSQAMSDLAKVLDDRLKAKSPDTADKFDTKSILQNKLDASFAKLFTDLKDKLNMNDLESGAGNDDTKFQEWANSAYIETEFSNGAFTVSRKLTPGQKTIVMFGVGVPATGLAGWGIYSLVNYISSEYQFIPTPGNQSDSAYSSVPGSAPSASLSVTTAQIATATPTASAVPRFVRH